MGYIRARVQLVPAEEGGPADGIADNHWAYYQLRPDIRLGAELAIEGADRLAAGETGYVRLYPKPKAAWQRLLPLNRPIHMLDSDRREVVAVVEIIDRVPGAIWWEA